MQTPANVLRKIVIHVKYMYLFFYKIMCCIYSIFSFVHCTRILLFKTVLPIRDQWAQSVTLASMSSDGSIFSTIKFHNILNSIQLIVLISYKHLNYLIFKNHSSKISLCLFIQACSCSIKE